MSELKRLRTRANRTQQKVVQDLTDLAARLHAEGRIAKPPTFSIRQLSKWEGPSPPWPHPEAREVLAAYWGRPVEELGFRPPRAREPDSPPGPHTGPSDQSDSRPVSGPGRRWVQPAHGPGAASVAGRDRRRLR